jgi:hypothetical protein
MPEGLLTGWKPILQAGSLFYRLEAYPAFAGVGVFRQNA